MRKITVSMDDRGVSTTVSYALNLTLSAMLISALLFAAGSIVGDERRSAVEAELEVIGERIASGIQSADRLNQTNASIVNLSVTVPERVAGSDYTVSINNSSSPPKLVLETTNPDITVRITVTVTGQLSETSIDGGTVVIVLAANGNLEVHEE